MSETIKEWFKQLYTGAIEETTSAIGNEKMWLNGCDDGEECHSHIDNINELEEYVRILNEKIEELG